MSSECRASILLVAFLLASNTQIAASAADNPNLNTSFLQLKDGSAGYGQLLGFTDDGYITWQNEGFVLPFEFPIGSVQSISPATVAMRIMPREKNDSSQTGFGRFPWNLDIKGNVRLVGEIQEFGPELIRLRSRLLGTLTINRSKALRIDRNFHLIEPGASPGTTKIKWDLEDDNNDWQTTGHSIFTRVRGAILTSHLQPSPGVEFHLRLRWEGTANFLIGLGPKRHARIKIAERAIQIDGDRVARPVNLNSAVLAIEAWAGKLFVVQENGKSMETASLGDFGDQSGTLELILLPATESTPTIVQVLGGPRIELKRSGNSGASRIDELIVRNQGNYLAIDSASARFGGSVLANDIFAKTNSFAVIAQAPVVGGLKKWDTESGIVQLEHFGKPDRLSLPQDQITSARILADDQQSIPTESIDTEDSFDSSSPQNPAFENVEPIGDFCFSITDGARFQASVLQIEGGQLIANIPGVAETFTIPGDSIELIYPIDVTQETFANQLEKSRYRVDVSPSRETAHPVTKFADQAKDENAFSGTAYLGCSQLKGQLLDSREDTQAVSLVWSPTSSRKSSPIDPGTQVELRSSQSFAKSQNNSKETCAVIQLVSGDRIPATITGIDEQGIYFRTSVTTKTSLPHEWIRSIDFKDVVRQPSMTEKQKERLLTVTHSQQNDLPSHLILSTSGDVLKGRLTVLSESSVSIEMRRRVVQLPLVQIHQIIWLNSSSQVEPENQTCSVRIVRADAEITTFEAVRVEHGQVIGTSPIFGDVRIELGQLRAIAIGAIPQVEEYRLSFAPEAD